MPHDEVLQFVRENSAEEFNKLGKVIVGILRFVGLTSDGHPRCPERLQFIISILLITNHILKGVFS